MLAWFETWVDPAYAPAVMWTVIALIVLIVLLIVLRLLRGLSSGTFVMGGRNRKARLAIMDATAVDATRRLVLVRRDDVEHLILIGGPTDVVVEQNIRPMAPARRQDEPAAVAAPEPVPAPRPVERPIAAPQRQAGPVSAPQPQRVPAPQAAYREPDLTAASPPAAGRPQTEAAYVPPVAAIPERPVAPPVAAPVARDFPAASASTRAEPMLDIPASRQAPPVSAVGRDDDERALEDEMNRLLGDISPQPRR